MNTVNTKTAAALATFQAARAAYYQALTEERAARDAMAAAFYEAQDAAAPALAYLFELTADGTPAYFKERDRREALYTAELTKQRAVRAHAEKRAASDRADAAAKAAAKAQDAAATVYRRAVAEEEAARAEALGLTGWAAIRAAYPEAVARADAVIFEGSSSAPRRASQAGARLDALEKAAAAPRAADLYDGNAALEYLGRRFCGAKSSKSLRLAILAELQAA